MGIQCSCRALNDAAINERLEDLNPNTEIDHKVLSEHCGGEKGGYQCGSCKPFFVEKAKEIKAAREMYQDALRLPKTTPATQRPATPRIKEPV